MPQTVLRLELRITNHQVQQRNQRGTKSLTLGTQCAYITDKRHILRSLSGWIGKCAESFACEVDAGIGLFGDLSTSKFES